MGSTKWIEFDQEQIRNIRLAQSGEEEHMLSDVTVFYIHSTLYDALPITISQVPIIIAKLKALKDNAV